VSKHPIALLIDRADKAINAEDFDAVVDLYTEDAVLVIKPGTNAVGKAQIRRAMEEIATYFNSTLDVHQAGMMILETGDTALVLADTVVSAKGFPSMNEKRRTYSGKTHSAIGCAPSTTHTGTKFSIPMPNPTVNRTRRHTPSRSRPSARRAGYLAH